MKLLPTESHRLWLRAFLWWWRNGGDRSQIDALRAEGVELCEADAIFLDNMEHARDHADHKVLLHRSGRSQGLDVFIEATIDNDVVRMRAKGVKWTPDVIRGLEAKWGRKFTAGALRQRPRKRVDSITEFAKLYDDFSKVRMYDEKLVARGLI